MKEASFFCRRVWFWKMWERFSLNYGPQKWTLWFWAPILVAVNKQKARGFIVACGGPASFYAIHVLSEIPPPLLTPLLLPTYTFPCFPFSLFSFRPNLLTFLNIILINSAVLAIEKIITMKKQIIRDCMWNKIHKITYFIQTIQVGPYKKGHTLIKK